MVRYPLKAAILCCFVTQDFWCRQTSFRLNPPEYLFVERCLTSLVGWRLSKFLFGKHGLPVGRRFSVINPDPVDSRQYPVGNWLQAVRDAYGCADNLDLEKRFASLPPGSRPSSPISQLRLNKWACGEDLIPLDIGESMVLGLPGVHNLKHGLMEARSTVFLQEFVSAEAPPSAEVRFVVHKRVEVLTNKLHFVIQKALQGLPPAAGSDGTIAALPQALQG